MQSLVTWSTLKSSKIQPHEELQLYLQQKLESKSWIKNTWYDKLSDSKLTFINSILAAKVTALLIEASTVSEMISYCLLTETAIQHVWSLGFWQQHLKVLLLCFWEVGGLVFYLDSSLPFPLILQYVGLAHW